MKYIALAYVGLAWLDKLGEFNSKESAMKALENEIDKQLNEEGLTDFDRDWIIEHFWFNSRIEEVNERN